VIKEEPTPVSISQVLYKKMAEKLKNEYKKFSSIQPITS